MTYKKGDGIRVKPDATGVLARYKGRVGEILRDGPRMISSRGQLLMGSAATPDHMTSGYSVRLFSDELGHEVEDDLTIPTDSLELIESIR
ncbi:MAG: hypothetical protein JW395_0778 [Nitrospira sp.]|nr:hypothetical protein [Nitrospira sp.]